MERIKVVLPMPLRPSSATISAGADLERDAVQDMGVAVEAVQIPHFEHQGASTEWGLPR